MTTRAKPGYTKAPCPGCSKEIEHPKGGVCPNCAEAIADWNATKSVTQWRSYRIGYADHCSRIYDAPGLGECLHNIAVAISAGPAIRAPSGELDEQGNRKQVMPVGSCGENQRITLLPTVAELIGQAFRLSKEAVRNARIAGKKEGRNLLVGLNDGSLSMDEYVRTRGE
jgi:hypothetical protein